MKSKGYRSIGIIGLITGMCTVSHNEKLGFVILGIALLIFMFGFFLDVFTE